VDLPTGPCYKTELQHIFDLAGQRLEPDEDKNEVPSDPCASYQN
jgi:hypothetical protein